MMPSMSFASITLLQLCLLASLLTVVRAASLVSRGNYPVPRGLPYNDPPQWIRHFRENSDKGEASQVGWAYSWGSSMYVFLNSILSSAYNLHVTLLTENLLSPY